jgi:hypothetical protein
MPISKEQLAQIISGPARELCNRQTNETPTSVFASNPSPNDYDSDAAYFDSLYLNEDSEQPASDMFYNQKTAEKSKLPSMIKESMLNNKIDVSSFGNTSVLDTMVKKTPKSKPINENVTKQQQQQTRQPSNIDYALIKTIVNDCLSSYFSENDSLSKIQLKSGNIFITDNKGETYVAKLEKINKQ